MGQAFDVGPGGPPSEWRKTHEDRVFYNHEEASLIVFGEEMRFCRPNVPKSWGMRIAPNLGGLQYFNPDDPHEFVELMRFRKQWEDQIYRYFYVVYHCHLLSNPVQLTEKTVFDPKNQDHMKLLEAAKTKFPGLNQRFKRAEEAGKLCSAFCLRLSDVQFVRRYVGLIPIPQPVIGYINKILGSDISVEMALDNPLSWKITSCRKLYPLKGFDHEQVRVKRPKIENIDVVTMKDEMSEELFSYLVEYIKFFSNSKMQKEAWADREPWDQGTCEHWLCDAINEWRRIRPNLNYTCQDLSRLVKSIDYLQPRLIEYFRTMHGFGERRMGKLHSKILNDPAWVDIQIDASIILRQANEILDP